MLIDLRTILYFCSILVFVCQTEWPFGHRATNLYAQEIVEQPVYQEPVIDEEFKEGDVDDELEQEELSLSHDEIRNRYQYGVALTQGVVLPWQMRGGALYKLEGEYASHLLSTGGGHFSFYDSTTSRRDKTAFDSISLFYSYRVFFTEMMPIFFEGSVGYATWNGTFEAMDLGLENAGGSEVASAFEASGAVAGINLGFMWPWENGIFVEYSLQFQCILKLNVISLLKLL